MWLTLAQLTCHLGSGGGTGEEQKIVLGLVSTLAEEIQLLLFSYWYNVFLSSNYTYGPMSLGV